MGAAFCPTLFEVIWRQPSGLVYSTTTGNTETIAEYISTATGLAAVDIGDLAGADIAAFDGTALVRSGIDH